MKNPNIAHKFYNVPSFNSKYVKKVQINDQEELKTIKTIADI